MLPDKPSCDSLPLQQNGPRGNAWGLFGNGDELGMLNRLSPENTIAATKESPWNSRLDEPEVR